MNEHLNDIREIRTMMERSSRFISLSGLSGVCAGLFALAGALAAYRHFGMGLTDQTYIGYSVDENGEMSRDFYTFFFADGISVLLLSLVAGFFFTRRKAKKQGLAVWDRTARRLVISLLIPLMAGGFFCLILLNHGIVGLIAPVTLIFYGLALLNASKYTFRDIYFLGISQVALGLIASLYIGYGLLFWAFGFGVLHIVYGILMYYKYER